MRQRSNTRAAGLGVAILGLVLAGACSAPATPAPTAVPAPLPAASAAAPPAAPPIVASAAPTSAPPTSTRTTRATSSKRSATTAKKSSAGCGRRAVAAGTFDPSCSEYQGYLDPGRGGGRGPSSGDLQSDYADCVTEKSVAECRDS